MTKWPICITHRVSLDIGKCRTLHRPLSGGSRRRCSDGLGVSVRRSDKWIEDSISLLNEMFFHLYLCFYYTLLTFTLCRSDLNVFVVFAGTLTSLSWLYVGVLGHLYGDDIVECECWIKFNAVITKNREEIKGFATILHIREKQGLIKEDGVEWNTVIFFYKKLNYHRALEVS